ncbi:hypothetical protein BJ912DRAFT_855031, partial [Pholiota molesta]
SFPAALLPIVHFHSTVVMNYIASYGLVCLYPELTLGRRGVVNHQNIPHRVANSIQKYRERGFDIQTGLNAWDATREHECGVDATCPTTPRRLLDGSALFIAFEPGDMGLGHYEDDVRWRLRVDCHV